MKFLKITGLIVGILMVFQEHSQAQKTVEYQLSINDTTVNFTGKNRKAIVVNGSIPGPTLYFTEGDTAIIKVSNKMKVETSTHWHGLLLPNSEDGVPYLTTPPILPGTTHTFKFPLKQSGTYWYHSHTNLQEQSGVYGSIVIYPKEEKQPKELSNRTSKTRDKELVLLLSDWTDEKPEQVMKNLKRGSEWYSIKKKRTQSAYDYLKNNALRDRLKASWDRMPPMDISDVAYDKFLINGKEKQSLSNLKPGERIKLRIINGSASTYFNLQFAGGKMEVVAADGLDVVPVAVDRGLIAIAETYDVFITIPEDGSYEFRATAQDGSGYASLFLGNGEQHFAPAIPKPDIYKMGDMHDMEGMDMGNMSSMKGHNMKTMGAQHEMSMTGSEDISMNQNHSNMKMEGHSMGDMAAMSHEMGMSDSEDISMNQDHSNMEMEGRSMEHMEGMQHKMSMSDSTHLEKGNAHYNMTMNSANMQTDGEIVELNYDMLRSPIPTTINENLPVREVKLELTGNMRRYVWSMNNKTLSEADKISIKKGEKVVVTLVNKTMMNHPMHLHGHFFRVLNAQGEYSPLKHTVNVKPMETVVIEFEANEEKDWFFHCHVLYHMMAGMARVFSYEDNPADSAAALPVKTEESREELYQNAKKKSKKEISHNPFYTFGQLNAMSHMSELNFTAANSRNQLNVAAEGDYRGNFRANIDVSRFLDENQFLSLYAGTVIYGGRDLQEILNDNGNQDVRRVEPRGVIGVRYLLPFFISSDLSIDTKLHPLLELSGEIPLFSRFNLEWSANTDREFQAGIDYVISRNLSLVGNYSTEFGWGGGLGLRF
ncbi:multicopper oxidase domain-containing protein [Xanthovirga aplysinae]|uniref:multicopper oxidase domain-containing protein n=1 Tax=Xanthovirga aplysinae TaxID=2529853 RepID=UPI0012BD4817|nr:multicopper oxidase domain-containing protein [Xanthovirga aplysinae]MTI31770.1 copper oxidase [Xanthovirga aplysinae]